MSINKKDKKAKTPTKSYTLIKEVQIGNKKYIPGNKVRLTDQAAEHFRLKHRIE